MVNMLDSSVVDHGIVDIVVNVLASVNVYLFLRIFVPDGKNILIIFFLQNFFHGILFP